MADDGGLRACANPSFRPHCDAANMERDGAGESSRRHSERVIGFAVASLVAPLATLVVGLGIIAMSGPLPDFAIPSDWGQFFGTLATAIVLLVAGSLTFGFLGSAILLGMTFTSLVVLMEGRGKAGVRHFMLAGALAGGLHVGLAYWSTHGWPKGPGGLLGTWLLRGAFEQGVTALALAPPIAGAVAGFIYARLSSAGPRRR